LVKDTYNGIVRSKYREKILTVNAPDIKLSDVISVETSFSGIVGLSGNLLIRQSSKEVIGLMSIGLPPDTPEKTRLFAISVKEINIARKRECFNLDFVQIS